MNGVIKKARTEDEYFFEEGCYILEYSNSADDAALSIVRARVPVGVTTRRHRLRNTVERYVIQAGTGAMEVADLPPQLVGPGDVVIIPADTAQRIRNTGTTDLVFLALCTPRFVPSAYQDLEASGSG